MRAVTAEAVLSPARQGNRPEGGYQGPAFDEEQYVDTIPPVFEYLRAKAGFEPKLLHDVHSHLSGMNAVELARRLQPYQMFFVEDILPPEQIALLPQHPPDLLDAAGRRRGVFASATSICR